jgi:hypothetical protein
MSILKEKPPMRTTDELSEFSPGNVVITSVPSAAFQAVGWRDSATGELFVNRAVEPPPGKSLEDAISDLKEQLPDLEVVTGKEAEEFLRAIEKMDLH